MKAPDVTFLARRKAAFERLKRELLGGSGGNFLKRNTQKRCFQRLRKPSISFPGKAGVHSNSL